MSEVMVNNSKGFMCFNTMETAMQWGNMIAESSFAPKDFKGRPGDIIIAVQYGQELGLQPMQALQNIAVINGRPSLWGDAVLAVCKTKSDFEYCDEQFDESTCTAVCKIKRRGEPEQIKTFSKKDAELAGLWNKQGPWRQYPKRMLQMRARSFALRDLFGHHLKGLSVAEEMIDITVEKDITPKTPTLSLVQQEQVSYLKLFIDIATDADLEVVLTHFNASCVEELTEEQAEKAYAGLLKKRERVVNG